MFLLYTFIEHYMYSTQIYSFRVCSTVFEELFTVHPSTRTILYLYYEYNTFFVPFVEDPTYWTADTPQKGGQSIFLPQQPPPQMLLPPPQLIPTAAVATAGQQSHVMRIGGKSHMQNAGPTFVLLQPGASATEVACKSPFPQVVQCPHCGQAVTTTTRTLRN